MAKKFSKTKSAKLPLEQSNKRVSARNEERAAKTVQTDIHDARDAIEDKWDCVRKTDEAEKLTCRNDGCKKLAIAVWSSSVEPDDFWAMCRLCQDEAFPPETQDQDAVMSFISLDSKEESTEKEEKDKLNSVECKSCGEDGATIKKSDSDHSANSTINDAKSLPFVLNCESDDKDGENCDSVDSKWHSDDVATIQESNLDHGANSTTNSSASLPFVGNGESTESNDGEKIDSLEKKWYSEDATTMHESETRHDTDSTATPSDASLSSLGIVEKGDESASKDRSGKSVEFSNIESSTDTNKISIGDSLDANIGITKVECNNGKGSVEVWELVQILTLSRLDQEGTIKCSSKNCALAACSIWKSNWAPSEKWFSCMDCQDADFDGWPPYDELPLKYASAEHKRIMTQKCTKQSKPRFPDLWNICSPNTMAASGSAMITNTITPTPNFPFSASDQDTGAATDTATVSVTIAKLIALCPTQPSKSAMAMHRKWQEAAEAVGGASARIVVSKPAAKALIFDMIHDSFRPMNITQIHTELKAIVPSPVLKSCLAEMVDNQDDDAHLFEVSDDEDECPKTSKAKGAGKNEQDRFAGSLLFKCGRNVNTSLYYVSQCKLINNGNGLDHHSRNELFTEKSKSEIDESDLRQILSGMVTQSTHLLAEPVNEEANAILEDQEMGMKALRENLEDARALKVNEKHKKQVKRRIETMTTQWRKRRRICLDFLTAMEESTDGAISAKKCLSGEGQIDIDSDQAAIRDAKTFASKKKTKIVHYAIASGRPNQLGKGLVGGSKAKSDDINLMMADENFIAVELNSQGCVCRVFLGN